MPGECRYGKWWPEGEDPREKKKIAKEQQQQEDIFETFRREALKNEKVLQGKMSIHPDFAMNNEQTAIFKMCMLKLLSEALASFEELEQNKLEHNYTHWLEDPTSMSWLKKIFLDYMVIEGVLASLQPWSKPTPDPVLALEKAPLRLLVRGGIDRWTIMQIEDLRELSASQWHEPMDLDDDWMIALFGSDKSQSQEGSSSSTSSRAIVPVQDDRVQEQQQPADQEGELAPLQQPEIEVLSEDQPEARAGALRPSFDFRRVFKRLPTLVQKGDLNMARRLILGLHERMWHCPHMDVRSVLIRCGMPHEVWRLTADAVASCMICRKFSRAGRRPQTKGFNLSYNFNDVVQMDLFKYQDLWYALMIDEATRYKIATRCEGGELPQILAALMKGWIRYFGPVRTLVTDQESSLMTIGAGDEFQRLGIARQPAGTTSGRQGQKHTTTGLVEKHIDLVKLTMLKTQAEAGRYGIEVEGEELAAEASMAQNTTTNVGGYSPVTMVFGILPRGYLDPEADEHGDVEHMDPSNQPLKDLFDFDK